ncbi:hypothetical protein Ancab_033850 [Ancistrocladus abbreviatus]
MPKGSSVCLVDPKEKGNYLIEISNVERQLWARIHSGGPLHADVQDLYRKACCIYEKILLCDNSLEELQDIEFSLWKLHYKHIGEFRNRISHCPSNEANTLSALTNRHIEGFKLFLSQSSNFYQDLIKKIKKYYGLSEECLFKNLSASTSIERTKLHKSQFLCHRLQVCLGDLARYSELYGKPDIQQRNWSIAAKCYCEAAKIYPDSGNPQNQLAVLATYVGDEFLALYHCVRSLAVKEPFPDALDNLILLFEKNWSNHIQPLSSVMQFDFLKPSERISLSTETHGSNCSSNGSLTEGAERVCSTGPNLWPFLIRMIGFFFLKSSLDDFPCTFALTVRELEALLALDDAELATALESYQNLNLSRAGPYRALHIVTALIFIIHNLSEGPQTETKWTNDVQQLQLAQLAFTAIFICMGRFADTCLKGHPKCFPLLPAILVFVEWLARAFDKVEAHENDEKCTRAMSYFFGSFVELLNQLIEIKDEVSSADCIALWEDYEMRGFTPLFHAHLSLDFSIHWENENNFTTRNDFRVHRIIQAGMSIVNRSTGDTKRWMVYDKVRKKFCTMEAEECLCKTSEEEKPGCSLEAEELQQQISNSHHDKENNKFDGDKSIAVEEEEDIVFKPITRHNSAPLHTYLPTTGQLSQEGMKNQLSTSDEGLRRASSLLIAQNRALIDSLTPRSPAANAVHSGPLRQHDPLPKAPASSTYPEVPISAGPPSLSAWVLDGESLVPGREKSRGIRKNVLEPIGEAASDKLSCLSLGKGEEFSINGREGIATHYYSPPYCTPVPSAPLLPEDAPWYSNWMANNGPLDTGHVPSFVHHSPPVVRPMNSSPWSYPLKSSHGNSYSSHETARLEVFDGWGYPLASAPAIYLESSPSYPRSPYGHAISDQKMEMLFHDYPTANYLCGTVRDIRAEQQPLLQYLNGKEWQLQQQSQDTGSTRMRN